MTLGVLGTMVWDRIDHPDGEIVERWGGITYSLAAAAAAAPKGWRIRPIIKLGADLADEGWAFLESLPGVELPGGVVEVAEPNNRVHLRYRDRHDREEQLSGGVPAWTWSELASHVRGLDGLYVNMIAGFELDHETVTTLSHRFDGPRYVDLHSLVLGVAPDGRRVPRTPAHREAWLGAFHVIQMNRRELALMAGAGEPESLARDAVRRGARAVVVTRGPEGATWFARADAPLGQSPDPTAEVRSGRVPASDAWTAGDPTGCGDVWGATCFLSLLRGERLSSAVEDANRAAARNVGHRGADGLYRHLRAEP